MRKSVVFLLVTAVGVTAYFMGLKNSRSSFHEFSRPAQSYWYDPEVKEARIRARKAAAKPRSR
ncbi:hypothetical protein [Homoserinimonas sp. OAct 916]|uniref:hypothetical protein n=1 Tax=Homoserinimonas sp. OAct 916 TaxID=2211450 RepID=UPI000DBE3DC1|nr:hypothetical protein [Homoserinimonas sp. OAct 916]